MKFDRLKKLSAEGVSRIVLYAMLAIVAVMFGLFYLVKYDHPYEDNPEYNEPLLSGALVSFTLIFVIITAVVWLAAVVVSLKRRERAAKESHGIRSSHIAAGVGAITLITLIVTFAFGSSAPLIINRASYQNVFWLKTADMFVNSIIVMLILAAVILIYGLVRRKEGKGK